ncbi:MAG: cysteine--tRNA ligase [Bacteroidetes bacterium]|nr:cysteine--tRNA ligase [Bacteroidota bacterium]MCY4204096.1 cysteine--tRNA ligase [Bacteroidota bacterium]
MNQEFRLYNTLTSKVEPLSLIEPDRLRFYSCGPTVYSYAHIGNFRSFLTADLILRTARVLGWKTTYVTNITDVGHLTNDDAIDTSGEDRMARALRSAEGKRFANVWDLSRYYSSALLADWRILNLLEPDVQPRATEHIREQIQVIEQLLSNGAAYQTSSGVYFSVASFPNYGKLSGNYAAEALELAVRDVVVDPEKKDPRDFALWKKDDQHLMQWHSPWGWGFPGWHIECSVMAQAYLGNEIDLHAGGEDLIFPHHECEIAQAEALTGKPFSRHWVHTRFLQVEGKKMSKRLGNFYTVRDLIQQRNVAPLAVRLALISGQYRKPFNFTFSTLRDSERHVKRFQEAFDVTKDAHDRGTEGDPNIGDALTDKRNAILSALLDDLNTPAAIAQALDGIRTILGHRDALGIRAHQFIIGVSDLLGIVPQTSLLSGKGITVGHYLNGADKDDSAADDSPTNTIEELIESRAVAREARDFSTADKIRDQLSAMNIEIKDNPNGTTWERKSDI